MKYFSEYNLEYQEDMVQIMRADYDCKQSVNAWIKAAREINPVIEWPAIIVSQQVIRAIGKKAGESWE